MAPLSGKQNTGQTFPVAELETETSHAGVLDRLSLTARAVAGGWLAGLVVHFVHSGGIVKGLWQFENNPRASLISFLLPTAIFLAMVSVWRWVRALFRDAYTSTPWSAAYSGASAAILLGLAMAVIIYLDKKGISTPMCLTILGLGMCGIVALVVECEAAWLRVCREQHDILAPRWLAAIAGGAWCVCAYMALASFGRFQVDAEQAGYADGSQSVSPPVTGVSDTRQATLNTWSELQEAIMTMHEAEGPKTSVRFNRLARDLSRLTASNADSALIDYVRRFTAFSQNNAKFYAEYEAEIDSWQAEWKAKGRGLENTAGAVASQGRTADEANSLYAGFGLLGGVMLEVEAKNEWDAINKRFMSVFDSASAGLSAFLSEGSSLATKLQGKYGEAFVVATP